MNSALLFVLIVTACIVAEFVFFLVKESSISRSNAILRITNFKYRVVTDLLTEVRKLKKQYSEKNVKKRLKKNFRDKSFSFMRTTSPSKQYEDAVDFIREIITNDSHLSLLFEYSAEPIFNKTLFEQFRKAVEKPDKCSDARSALKDILKDKSEKSIENAMKWLPKLMTPPFIQNPEDSEEKICKTKNTFSILYYLREGDNSYFQENLSLEKYLNCLKALRKLNDKMEIPERKSNASFYMKDLKIEDKRRTQIIKTITERN